MLTNPYFTQITNFDGKIVNFTKNCKIEIIGKFKTSYLRDIPKHTDLIITFKLKI